MPDNSAASVVVTYRAPGGATFTIRPLATHQEYAACIALQHDTWGHEFDDVVPASILMVSQKIGGVSAGAFEETGRLVGFVFGMSGVRDDRFVHWSDMLAVRPELRDSGLGQAMKDYQRDVLRRIGVESIFWTFDPLVARNAHFNLHKLGARVVDYVVDMYGADTGSSVHRGIGSDRFIVEWDIRDDANHAPPPNVNRADGRVEIPSDIAAIQARSLDEAAQWRLRTRQAFLQARDAGLVVTGFQRTNGDRSFYLLRQANGTDAAAR